MLQKWKDILINWINCYFHETDKIKQCVTLESLLNIISHLRENLNLDESKSSILEAHTVEEFVQEKFPEFSFENGSVEATSEEELYIVSSLLLFFVCVNSKDVDIKNAMCSNLSADDQEIILNFSKCMMECCPITYKDVQRAIIEACSPDTVPTGASSSRCTVSETPPALRSLHGEVRRLQAALDAERFDRNYLQEELARTNLRLTKDKERYKLEIVNLKAKISMCCEQESDPRSGDSAAEGTAKLMRQLEETEERLVETQGLLDDAQYERDTYKAKINELKQERDKWLTLSQQETDRVTQLSEELDTERRHVQSLRDLLTELRQHNQLNRLDSSQLECDDPDASIQSLPHNASICSEACANVIEVQLGEERAKIVVLKQHIQSLQEQLNELSHKSESEKLSLERIVSENENVIFNLKHRINEEIEEKNNMTVQYSDDVSKLNNEINELEQKLKDNNNQFRLVVETKMQEIQTLQEEKLSLLQSLTDETTKLENDITKMKSELDFEKNLRAKMKDDYENHIMKLNEKILNRNNELVELQNNLCKTGEQVEAIHLELRKEKQAKDELTTKYHNEYEELKSKLIQTDDMLQRKCEEVDELVERLNYNFDVNKELNREINDLKYSLAQQNDNCRALEETKTSLLDELSARHHKIEELHKNIENLANVHSEEMNKLGHDVDSALATVNTLQMQLQDELQYKVGLQIELAQLKHAQTSVVEQLELLKAELNQSKIDIQDKEKTIEGLDLFLQEEKRTNEKLKADCDYLNAKIKQMSEEITFKSKATEEMESRLNNERMSFEKDLRSKDEFIERVNEKLSLEMHAKAALELELENEKEKLSGKISELQEINAGMNETIEQKEKCIQILQDEKLSVTQDLTKEMQAKAAFELELNNEKEKMSLELNQMSAKIFELQEIKIGMNETIEQREKCIQLLQEEKEALAQNLTLEMQAKAAFELELKNYKEKMSLELSQMSKEISKLQETNSSMDKTIKHSDKWLQILQEEKLTLTHNLANETTKLENNVKILKSDLDSEKEYTAKLKVDYENNIRELDGKILNKNNELVALRNDIRVSKDQIETINSELRKAKLAKDEIIVKCQNEYEEMNSKLTQIENTLQEKCEEVNNLVEKLNCTLITSEELTREVEQLKHSLAEQNNNCVALENAKTTILEELSAKTNRIEELQKEIEYLTNLHSEQMNKVSHDLDSALVAVNTLEAELQNKLQHEVVLQNELVLLKHSETALLEKVELLTAELNESKIEIDGKVKTIKEIDSLLKDEKRINEKLNADYDNLNEKNKKLVKEILCKTEEMKKLESRLLNDKTSFEEELRVKDEYIEHVNGKLSSEIQGKSFLESELKGETEKMSMELSQKSKKISELQKINNKMYETIEQSNKSLQSLQEEKLSLLKSLADETTKFESVIKELKSDLDSEIISNAKLKEDYEKEIKLLDEKVSNKNKELVALQNDILVSKDQIETINSELEKEKQAKDELVAKYQNECKDINSKQIETNNLLHKKCDEFNEMVEKLNLNLATIKELYEEVDELKHSSAEQSKHCMSLEETKTSLLKELSAKNNIIAEHYKDMENLARIHSMEANKLRNDLELALQSVNTLQMKDQDNLQHDTELQNELTHLKNTKTALLEEVEVLKAEINKLQVHIQEKVKTIEELNSCLKKEKFVNDKLVADLNSSNEKIKHLSEEIERKTKKINDIEKIHDDEKNELEKELREKDVIIQQVNEKLCSEMQEKVALETELKTEIEKMSVDVVQKSNKISELQEIHTKTNNTIEETKQSLQILQEEKKCLLQSLTDETTKLENEIKELKSDLDSEKNLKAKVKEDYESEIVKLNETIVSRNKELVELQNNSRENSQQIESINLEFSKEKQAREELIAKYQNEYEEVSSKLIQSDKMLQSKCIEVEELEEKVNSYVNSNEKLSREVVELKCSLAEQNKNCMTLEETKTCLMNEVLAKNNKIDELHKNIENLVKIHSEDKQNHSSDSEMIVNKLQMKLQDQLQHENGLQNELAHLKHERTSLLEEVERLKKDINESKTYLHDKDNTIDRMDMLLQEEKRINAILKVDCDNLNDKIQKMSEEIACKNEEIKTIENEFSDQRNLLQAELREKDKIIEHANGKLLSETQAKAALESELRKEKEQMSIKLGILDTMAKELLESKATIEKKQADLEAKDAEVNDLRRKLDSFSNEGVMRALRSEEWVKAIGQKETFAVAASEKTGSHKISGPLEKDYREFLHQVDNTTSDLTHSSMESIKTISDLEKIIYDKNRTITSLQSDITYLKSLVADSENKLLDVNKELEDSKENCQQLSSQLKKIVHQKNEEIAELKKQVAKMSVTENRVSQIIKVSAKYQAIILKRIAEIKSNTVLKELTNFGNTANGDNDLRRSLNAGTISMEDLENFLETTDKHIKRCSEKQIALQKERDRLTEVNRINESEIINLKKFLSELSVSFKTFSTVKDLYAQKFSRVVSVQRTVRREILNLDGHINDATMCKLERGYAAVMQDLAECVMNMERWVERSIGRAISPEKIKQAFTGDEERASFCMTTFQNTGLEVQLEELDKSFQKLLEEVVRAQKGEGAKDAQAATVMEVRAEYEDKLNRMKAKMKQLYQEQISAYKEKQREEILSLKRELVLMREKMAESSRAYEEHIKGLTTELWSVGEKFLTKKDEVEWLRRRQHSGSLMSLQHVHSSGLLPPQELPPRPSDTHSLRSLPVHNNANTNTNKREGRGLHMSDEEGEVFDNRWLKELASTPGRPSLAASTPSRGTGVRLSELKWRNSLCPPHLKSSYPAETQFAPAFDEEDLKFSLGGASSIGGRNQRKEVGITAYKKPGPPTPSKQAGRLSATDSELRESMRVEGEPAARKTSTPSRLRSLFRSNKNDTTEGTPRSKRLSIFNRRK